MIWIKTQDRDVINAEQITRMFVRRNGRFEVCASLPGPAMPFVLGTYHHEQYARLAVNHLAIAAGVDTGDSIVLVAPTYDADKE